MIVKAVYVINYRYVIGDDRHIYRLPFTDGKKNYKLKRLKQHRGGYFIYGVFVEKSDIFFGKIKEPYEIINDEKLPF
jgi:hypothetical protein